MFHCIVLFDIINKMHGRGTFDCFSHCDLYDCALVPIIFYRSTIVPTLAENSQFFLCNFSLQMIILSGEPMHSASKVVIQCCMQQLYQ